MAGPNKDTPCRGCRDRHATCHANCKDYIQWKANYNEQANARKFIEKVNREADSDSIRRVMLARGRKIK